MKPRTVIIAGALLLAVVIIVSKLITPEKERRAPRVRPVATKTPARSSPAHRSVTPRRDYTVEAPPSRETTESLLSDDIVQAAAVTGYLVDNFRIWTSVPSGYTTDK